MPVPASSFLTSSLRSASYGEAVTRILAAAIAAVEPGQAVADHLLCKDGRLEAVGHSYELSRYRRVLVAGAGKACAPMAAAVSRVLGSSLSQGIIIVKEGYAKMPPPPGVELIEAGHPIPDERGVRGTRRIIDLLKTVTEQDLVIFLISGGGSALMTSPANGITLQDLQSLTSELLRRGANINEINTLRKHLDEVKGGGLARFAAGADRIALILSDVVGDPLDVIASGPTVPDSTTFTEAYEILERYRLVDQISLAIHDHIRRGKDGEIPENPKEEDPIFSGMHNRIIASNLQAAQAASEQAQEEGFHTLLLTNFIQGEARHVGRFMAAMARQIVAYASPLERPACLIAGGETTVTVTGSGKGGRNQEMALGAVNDLAGLRDVALVTLATDGGDGPTDAAGAVVTGETLEKANILGMNPHQYLADNNAYEFFNTLQDLLRPGPTMTNVNDLAFVFVL